MAKTYAVQVEILVEAHNLAEAEFNAFPMFHEATGGFQAFKSASFIELVDDDGKALPIEGADEGNDLDDQEDDQEVTFLDGPSDGQNANRHNGPVGIGGGDGPVGQSDTWGDDPDNVGY